MRFPTTAWQTIQDVQHEPARVQEWIVRRYRGVVRAYARRQGCQDADAEDVAQEVLFRVCRVDFLGKADRVRGKFRTLLLAVTRHVLASCRRRTLADRRDSRRSVPIDDAALFEAAPRDREFDRLWVRNLVAWAFQRLEGDPMVQALRWQMEGRSYREISLLLGKHEHDVTNWIHRAKPKLRREIEVLIREYAADEAVPGEIADLWSSGSPAGSGFDPPPSPP